MLKVEPVYMRHLVEVYEYFTQLELKNYELFLFGSCAKGHVNEYSDIDLLILLEEPIDARGAKQMRMELRDVYEEQINYAYEVDVKVYNKERFKELAAKPSFESEIASYMMPLREAIGR